MKVEYDEARNVARLFPEGTLSREDFQAAAATIDPHIEEHAGLAGLVIATESFPGWDSLGALVAHLRFVHEHHRQIARVALATDSAVGEIADKVGAHFVSAQVRHFPFADLAAATDWAAGR
ncbi:hypothetical protein A11A3_13345 [Alcanivorax hongdengensis A-11-3]|uniref:STAS/SEC14 domain-containing protein n=1 Tax=Alcanivorax hongdengensis A-11-3 TaxID=1177179 RepID=L0WCQ4_9GAMM|nr:STAS/SEC14 domain-containing protein [Alcanivorax hongdengensis]EKF73525.1 hypothetical protein A11A3_13345 [Alcanivorax hongdengensis A-11-3]